MEWLGINSAIAGLGKEVARMKLGLVAYAQMECAPMVEAYAHSTAPWNDISGDARRGLKSGVVLSGTKIRIYLAHTVDYGVYLELANDQRFAVIDPTLEHMAPIIYRGYARIMRS